MEFTACYGELMTERALTPFIVGLCEVHRYFASETVIDVRPRTEYLTPTDNITVHEL